MLNKKGDGGKFWRVRIRAGHQVYRAGKGAVQAGLEGCPINLMREAISANSQEFFVSHRLAALAILGAFGALAPSKRRI